MIRFEGTRSFALPLADVATRLSDAGFLAGCVPDAEITEATPDRAVGKVRPKLSFVTGTLALEATVTARDPGKSVAFQLVSKVIGGSSTVTTALEFREAAGGGTEVAWAGELVAVTGLLKVVPKGLLEGAAKKVIEDVWAGVSAKLA
jgi:carbon monoxide dehydrogenase subunit G